MKSISALVVLAIVAVTSTEAVFGPLYRMKNVFNGPPLPEKRSLRSLPDLWTDQRIDNFDAQNVATYRMVSNLIHM